MNKSELRQLIRETIKKSYIGEMQAVNKETGKDITRHILDYMEDKITKKEFEELTGLSKDTNVGEGMYDIPERKDYVVVDKRNLRPLMMNYGGGQYYEKWSTEEKAQADADELNRAYQKTYGAVEGPHVVMYKSDYYSEKRNLNEAIDPALMEQIAAGLLLILGPLGIKFGFDQLSKLADKYVSPAIDRLYGKVGAGAKFLSKNLSILRDEARKCKEALEIKLQDLLMLDDLDEVNYPTPEIELRRLGIRYTLSGNKNKPIEKVFKPIDKSDDFYRKFDDVVDRYGLSNSVVIEPSAT